MIIPDLPNIVFFLHKLNQFWHWLMSKSSGKHFGTRGDLPVQLCPVCRFNIKKCASFGFENSHQINEIAEINCKCKEIAFFARKIK
jgi:hypothetical protein